MKTLREDFCAFLSAGRTENNCWEWQGPVDDNGYGIFYCMNRGFQAHRSAAILFGKRIVLSKMDIYHTCDNLLCCNPRHIRIRDKMTQHTYDCMGEESMIPE